MAVLLAVSEAIGGSASHYLSDDDFEGLAGGCVVEEVPVLAETGLDSGASWLLLAALASIVGGGAMFAYRVSREGAGTVSGDVVVVEVSEHGAEVAVDWHNGLVLHENDVDWHAWDETVYGPFKEDS